MTAGSESCPNPRPLPRRLSRSVAYSGRILTVWLDRVALPNGHEVELELIAHPGASAVLPLHEDGSVTLIRQVRYATGGWLLEAPAGKLDAGEPPEVCAVRELAEEAGLLAGRLHPLGFIWTTPGFTDEVIHLFVATELAPTAQSLGADEVLEVERLPLTEALALAATGQVPDSKTLCLLLRADQELRAGRLSPLR